MYEMLNTKSYSLSTQEKCYQKNEKLTDFMEEICGTSKHCCWLKILSGSVALLFPFFPPRKDLIIFPPPLICRIFMTFFGVFWQFPLKVYHNPKAGQLGKQKCTESNAVSELIRKTSTHALPDKKGRIWMPKNIDSVLESW